MQWQQSPHADGTHRDFWNEEDIHNTASIINQGKIIWFKHLNHCELWSDLCWKFIWVIGPYQLYFKLIGLLYVELTGVFELDLCFIPALNVCISLFLRLVNLEVEQFWETGINTHQRQAYKSWFRRQCSEFLWW